MSIIKKTVFHMFGAIGGGAMGFKDARVQVGNMHGEWECLGSIDVDEAANRDFARLVGTNATTLDLMDREQYVAYWDRQPPEGWREATPDDIRHAAGYRRPNAVFLSAPCKGFSGLLSHAKSLTGKYQALNRLTLRGVWLMLEAWADDPVEIILFENVPRLATRGRALLDRITAMLRAYGYAVSETTHDCGELGGLAQSRKRFLLVARHMGKVPNFLYEPPRRPLRAVGDVLGKMALPGDLRAGPMHRIPSLSWKTWVRLAFVEAGKDWRSLNRLAVEDGNLRDYLIVPELHGGAYGVHQWDDATGVVAARNMPTNGNFSVADPRAPNGSLEYQQYGVRPWGEPSGAIIGVKSPGQGTFSVADPRLPPSNARHDQMFRVVRWDRHSATVTGSQQVGSGAACVADPRQTGDLFSKYPVTDWADPSGTVISGSTTGQGAYAVADPRSGMDGQREHYLTGGHYGVLRMEDTSGAVSSSACHDNGRWSVADPRMPEATDKLIARITAEDGTWHRPFTTLELAALQSLFDPEDPLEAAAFSLDGTSDQAWRERIGNAVPRKAAQAMASEILRTLMLADAGETFALSSTDIWVRPVIAGLSLAQGGAA